MEPQKFELKTQVVDKGRSSLALPETSRMRISLKYLESGGEAGLHSHTYEDQTYLVLDGEATFYNENDVPTVVRRGEGILMPAGCKYRFHKTGDTSAVVLRIGGTSATGWEHYLDGSGEPLTIDYCRVTWTYKDEQFWTLDRVS